MNDKQKKCLWAGIGLIVVVVFSVYAWYSYSQGERQFPFAELTKVTGNADFVNFAILHKFEGKLYNGSSWTITRVIFSVTAKEQNGSIRWQRDFSENITVPPLKVQSFSVDMTGNEGAKAEWSIKQVFGYKNGLKQSQ
jgi:hypothetical protein